jgi:GMP synthase (glutamine-hydrolysing)
VFWGVQYHPEYSFAEIAACAVRYGAKLIDDGLFAERAELDAFVADLRALMQRPDDPRLAWKHGLGPALREESLKLAELRNWLEIEVLPHAARRPKDHA